ncbi:branched-chain amino acid ABC transporter permease [Chloroflexota bacterium]
MTQKYRRAVSSMWQQRLFHYFPNIAIGLLLVALPQFTDNTVQSLITKVLIYAVFAMSLNIIFGYTGLLSLGHAAFFGVGGYTAGILITRYEITNFWVVAPSSIVVVAIFAAVIGFIALRVSGIYFLLLTMAMGQLLFGIALKWRELTGGTMGLAGMSLPDLYIPGFTMDTGSFYYLVFAVFIICIFLIYKLINSPFGYALRGIRDDEHRMRHLGYNTWLYKYIAFLIAGSFGGISGVLFGYYNSLLVPVHLGITTSAMVMLMVIIGGERVIFGPVLGAAVIVLLQYYSSIYIPERWPLLLGGVFILSVIFLRGGIGSYLARLWERFTFRYSYGSNKN